MPGLDSRESSLDEVGDRDAPAGSRPWSVWIIGQAKLQRSKLDSDAIMLRGLIDRMSKYEAWRALGFKSADDMYEAELKLDRESVAAVMAAIPGKPLGAVLGKHGRPKAGGGKR